MLKGAKHEIDNQSFIHICKPMSTLQMFHVGQKALFDIISEVVLGFLLIGKYKYCTGTLLPS